MRFMTSVPTASLNMTGNSPTTITDTVIILGLSRKAAPAITALNNAALSILLPDSISDSIARSKYSSMTMPNSAATPASAIKPTATATDN